jgi:hypothetical protein
MLAGMYQAVFDIRTFFQLFNNGRNFHEVWPGPNHAHELDHRENPATRRMDEV